MIKVVKHPYLQVIAVTNFNPNTFQQYLTHFK